MRLTHCIARIARALPPVALAALLSVPACRGDADGRGPGTNPPTAVEPAAPGAAEGDAAPQPATPPPAEGDAAPTAPTGEGDAAPTAPAPTGEADAAAAPPAGDAGAQGAAPSAAPTAGQTAELGQPAPGFTLNDLEGKPVSLADYKGKTVVLEWFNPDCPYVRHAYTEGPLKGMPGQHRGVVWLRINSGAEGQQGAGQARNQQAVQDWSLTEPMLLDMDGRVGKLYEAKTTPHMYVIDPQGTLVYRGAIDNAPLGRVQGDGEAVNYVAQALADLKAKQPVRVSDTRPYGCSVKYAK